MKYLVIFLAFICCFLVSTEFSYCAEGAQTPSFRMNASQGVLKSWKKIVVFQKKLNVKMTKKMKELKKDKSFKTLLPCLFLAFIYGIVHSLGPGHGKAVVVSYFLSNRSKAWKVPLMGFYIAFTHILTAIGLVVFADISIRQVIIDPDRQLYLFKLFSYSFIALIGLFLLIKNFIKISNKVIKEEMVGVFAGMVPCIGSLLVLLFAMANNILIIGVLITFAIAAGIAVTVTAFGFIAFYAYKGFEFSDAKVKTSLITRSVSILSALFIIGFSVLMLVNLT